MNYANKNYLIKAFSLIEVLVTIVIIGIVAGAAIPSYNNYQNKAKMSTAISYVEGLASVAIAEHALNGYFPDTIRYQDLTFTSDRTAQWLDRSNIGGFNYYVEPGGDAITISFSFKDLTGIPSSSYNRPSPGTPFPAKSEVMYAVDGNNYVKRCGVHHQGNNRSPVGGNFMDYTYVIKPCNCYNISSCIIK